MRKGCDTLMEYLAHSENEQGQVHELQQHLRATASIATLFASDFGASELAYYAGLLHDIGKFDSGFQARVRGEHARKTGHARCGAVQLHEWMLDWADLVSFVVAGHHAGIPSSVHLKEILKKRDSIDCQESLDLARKVLRLPSVGPEIALPDWVFAGADPERFRRTEFFVRMLYSAVTDADFLDTEAHFEQAKSELREKAEGDISLQLLWPRFNSTMAELSGRKTDALNRCRHEIYEQCLQAADGAPGIYRLTVPTGGGKTLASMAFALKHALKHGKRRVIVGIPYTSIIEQTADVYRGVFGPEPVLEHHSAYRPDPKENGDNEGEGEQELRRRLASENWDAPIIVTTNLQLMESLFANRSSRCRKLHNIANSIIILDEAQTLPLTLLNASADVLQELAENYGVTIVLCTATQPALEMLPASWRLPITEIVPDYRKYFERLKRVEYDFSAVDEKKDWEDVAQSMLVGKQALCILNTKAQAQALARLVLDRCNNRESVFHLSGAMCGEHRRQVLREIRRRLAISEPCYLVATQVVEAGVDIDFPLVLRALGPLDSIVQAAGRCNREGLLDIGQVVVFQPEQHGSPRGTYRTAIDLAGTLLHRGIDFDDAELFKMYFSRLYGAVNTDAQDIQRLRERFDFPEVNSRYRLIEDNTTNVVTPYQPCLSKIGEMLNKIRSQGVTRTTMRELQPFIVTVYGSMIDQLFEEGLLVPVTVGLWEWTGRYDEMFGISKEFVDPETLVF